MQNFFEDGENTILSCQTGVSTPWNCKNGEPYYNIIELLKPSGAWVESLKFDACVGVVDAGIKQKEAYTSSINANALWLSSIFKAEANNDRAIINHKMLDDKFSTIDSFRAFCKKLMKQGNL